MTRIAENLQDVRARIDAACLGAQRPVGSVGLLAVSKTFGPAQVLAASRAGQTDFGENYVQEALDKMAALKPQGNGPAQALIWHCIGPVQSNKTRQVAAHFDWVHSLDRLKTAQRLSDQRPPELAPLNVCLQVNIDGGANKAGVAPHEALALARAVAALPRLRLRGLMSLPEPTPDLASQLAIHQRARALFDQIRAELGSALASDHSFDTLSMGMSADLEAAVSAGSTLVRVGTAIFGGRV